MDYKKMYKEIPVQFRNEVWQRSGVGKTTISRWFTGKGRQASENTLVKIEEAIYDIWKPHALIKHLGVTLGRKIVVDHPTAIEYIEYSDLMSFKLQLEKTPKTSPNAVYDLLGSAQDVINCLWKEDPYETKLLIAKYIIHSQIDNCAENILN